MKKYLCTVCGHIYDEAAGDEKNHIAKETAFADLPEKWTCPVCGAFPSQFREMSTPAPAPAPEKTAPETPQKPVDTEALRKSIICSNLAKGCEKQYKAEDARLFFELAGALRAEAEKPETVSFSHLEKLCAHDIASLLPTAKKVAENHHDRGALRAVVWADKVTRIHHSLLERHAAEGPDLIKDKTVYLCPICGFIFIDNSAPDRCPVCSVPGWKFETVEA